MNQHINLVISQLNEQIKNNPTDDQPLGQEAISKIMTRVFTQEMNRVEPSQRKRFYQLLSVKIHTDRQSQEPFMQLLRTRGLESLPQQVLNRIAQDELQPDAEVKPTSYNPFVFARDIITRINELLINAWSDPLYLIRSSSDPETLSEEVLASLTDNNRCYILFEDRVYYLDAKIKLTSIDYRYWPEFTELFPADVDQSIRVDQEDMADQGEVSFYFRSFESALKNEYPDLYLFEHYSKQVQNIIWLCALGVNSLAVFFYTANVLVTMIPYHLIKRFEMSLLEFMTDYRYANKPAKIAVMKATLESMSIPVVELSDDDIEYAFNSIMLNSAASQRKYIDDYGHNTDDLSDTEFNCLFKKVYSTLTLESFAQSFPAILNHDSVNRILDCVLRHDLVGKRVEFILEVLDVENLNDAINEVYDLVNETKNKDLQQKINVTKYHIFSGFEHLFHVFNAMSEQWMDDASSMKRSTQVILGLVLMPLTLTRFLFDAEYYFVEAVIILGKVASVELINLPIYVHSYFNSGRAADPTPPAGLVPRLGYFANATVSVDEAAAIAADMPMSHHRL